MDYGEQNCYGYFTNTDQNATNIQYIHENIMSVIMVWYIQLKWQKNCIENLKQVQHILRQSIKVKQLILFNRLIIQAKPVPKSTFGELLSQCFLAHHTNGRAYGTTCRPSVVCNVLCIVTKRYVLPKNCPNKQIGFAYSTNSDPLQPLTPQMGYWLQPKILALRIAAKPLQFSG